MTILYVYFMMTKKQIIIIGAGAAGMAAATRLMEKGMNNFIILEASNRIGGRINTVDFADNVVDLGAQWVHGETGNIVYKIASSRFRFGSFSKLDDPNKHYFIVFNGEMIPKEEGIKALTIYSNIMQRAMEDWKKEKGSLGDYFTKEYYKAFDENPFTSRTRAAEFLSWMEKLENSIECCDTWFDVSAQRLGDYWHCEGDLLLNWKDYGYKTLFDLLLLNIRNPEKRNQLMEKIQFGKVVTTIDYDSEENVIVMTKDGWQYNASHVIFTGSLGVLKQKHSTMFVPRLPLKKQRAIKGLEIGTANKIFLEFTHRWWPEDMAALDFIWTEEDKSKFLEKYGQRFKWLCDVFSFFTVEYQPNVLCAWIIGKNARYIESLLDYDISFGLYLLLKTALKKHYDVARPKKILRSKWYTNEYFRGSYSFQSMKSEKLDVKPRDLAEPIVKNGKPVILFAGEATHDHYYSTVHGAVETGFREANRLIAFIERRLKSSL